MCLKIYRLLTIFTSFCPSFSVKRRLNIDYWMLLNFSPFLRDDLTLLDLKYTVKR
jgi:hypothetical protein